MNGIKKCWESYSDRQVSAQYWHSPDKDRYRASVNTTHHRRNSTLDINVKLLYIAANNHETPVNTNMGDAI